MAGSFVSYQDWEASKTYTTDSISIHNLRMVVNSGFDIWGRRKPQPVLISIKLCLKEPFHGAAGSDQIDASTIHYGHLTKRIIEVLEHQQDKSWLTPDELVAAIAYTSQTAAQDPSIVANGEVSVHFPKASRFGDGVTLTLFHNLEPQVNSIVMQIKELRLSAVVGVNAHERTMKQMLVISVWIDRVKTQVSESYFELEQLIAKTVEESSFQTLESLVEELAMRTVKYYILPKHEVAHALVEPAGVRIQVRKPNAVPSIDSPVIEIYRSADPQHPFGKRMVAELGIKRPQIPFPIEGRLDEFLQSWKQD